MFKRILNRNVTLFIIVLLLTLTFDILLTAPQESQVRNIPGITADDTYPLACVSCHKNYQDGKGDLRITTIMKDLAEKVDPAHLAKYQAAAPEGVTLKGKHPTKSNENTSVPEDCNKCHGKSMKTALPLGQIIHIAHLTGGKDNKFITMFNGDCSHCHKFDAKMGTWSHPNGKESDIK